MQTTLDKFVGNSSSSDSGSSDPSFHLSEEEKPKAANWWTRCKSRNQLGDQLFALYNINDELKLWQNKNKKRKAVGNDAPALVFDPQELNNQIEDWSIDNYRCSDEELMRYGRMAAEVRRKIRDRAGAKEDEERKLEDD